jgi:hypothetical protein
MWVIAFIQMIVHAGDLARPAAYAPVRADQNPSNHTIPQIVRHVTEVNVNSRSNAYRLLNFTGIIHYYATKNKTAG